MKIFEIREYSYGDYNDRGDVIGYVRESSKEEAEAKHKTSNWIGVREITQEDYLAQKKQAEEKIKMFTF